MSCKVCDTDLRHRVDILERGARTPAPGKVAPSNVYNLKYRVWAAIRTGVRASGSRQVEGVEIQTNEQLTHEIYIRYRADPPDIRDRVRDNKGDLYEIRSVENMGEEDEWLRLQCIRRGDENQAAAS
ncbi:MAG: head-tail adaptor protein [Dichotomicrobium sp.]